MADTVFVNSITLSDEDWFNDLNRLHYTIFADPANVTAAMNTLLAPVIDAAGDTIVGTAADTVGRLPAAATVAAHATTMDPWNARVVTLSGSAVTFTDITDADYVGQTVLLIMNAAHIWTDGAVFDVQGGATHTCAAGDQVLLVATAVDAFDVTIFPALMASQAMQEAGTDVLTPVTPGRQHFHPSAAKGWAKADYAGSAAASYNVSSITDVGTGVVQVNWNTDFSSAHYSVVANAILDPGATAATTPLAVIGNTNFLAASVQIVTVVLSTYGAVDLNYVTVTAFGDQA